MPALIRQTARKEVEPHIVWGSFACRFSTAWRQLFSDLDVKLGFCDIDKFVVRFCLNLRIVKLRPQFLELGLKLQNRLRKFLFLDLRKWFGRILGFFDSFHGCYLRVLFHKDSNPFVKNRTGYGKDLADMRPTHTLFEVQLHRFLIVEIAFA